MFGRMFGQGDVKTTDLSPRYLSALINKYPTIEWSDAPVCTYEEQLWQEEGNRLVIRNAQVDPREPSPWNWYHVLRRNPRSIVISVRPDFETQTWWIDFVSWASVAEKREFLFRPAESSAAPTGMVKKHKTMAVPYEPEQPQVGEEVSRRLAEAVDMAELALLAPRCKRLGQSIRSSGNIITIHAADHAALAAMMRALSIKRFMLFYIAYQYDILHRLLTGRYPYVQPSLTEIQGIVAAALREEPSITPEDLHRKFERIGARVGLNAIRHAYMNATQSPAWDADEMHRFLAAKGAHVDQGVVAMVLRFIKANPEATNREIVNLFHKHGVEEVNLGMIKQMREHFKPRPPSMMTVWDRWASDPMARGQKVASREQVNRALWALGLPMGLTVQQLQRIDTNGIVAWFREMLDLRQYTKGRRVKYREQDRETGRMVDKTKTVQEDAFGPHEIKLAGRRLQQVVQAAELVDLVRAGAVKVSPW